MTTIPEGRLQVLKAYGYTTAEQVFYLAQALGPELADLVGIAPLDLQMQLGDSLNLLSQSDEDELMALPLTLGVPIDLAPPTPQPMIMSPVIAASAASVSHIANMPPIQNQGVRGTCVAYSALAVIEHDLTQNGHPVDLSEQFLYWDCKQNDGIPTKSGTWLSTAFPLLAQDGCCPETVWPYQSTPCATEDCGPPPLNAIPMSLPYRQRIEQIAPNSVDDIKAKLAAGKCVAFSVPVFRSWHQSLQVRADGIINMPLPYDIRVGGHAMCFVGYVDSSDPGIGGGRFILRNSWGETWAPQSAFGRGYGSIPYAYISRFCTEAFSVR